MRIELPQLTSKLPDFSLHYKTREFINVSLLDAAARCPRLYFYNASLLKQLGDEHLALTFGSAIHMALPELLTGDKYSRFTRALNGFNSIWQDNDNKADPVRNSDIAMKMLASFAASHENWPFELIEPPSDNPAKNVKTKSRWEVPFVCPIPGSTIPLVGTIDGIARHKATGELFVVEYKTAGQMAGQFTQSFTITPQNLVYTIAASALFGKRIQGTILEGLQAAKTKQTSQSNIYTYTDEQLSETLLWVSILINQIQEYERLQMFPKFFTGCAPYAMFGQQGYLCRFYSLCSTPDWREMLPMYDKKSPESYWDMFTTEEI